jgi:hypothetical protein
VLHTSDGGTNWTEQTSITRLPLYSIFFADENTGWAVGAFGTIIKTTNGGTTFIDETDFEEIPNQFFLLQNYPNPFNPTTNIRFRISDFGYVSLKVYDILGNEVAVLVDEYKPAGSYEVDFNTSNLKHQTSSGIYFYQIVAGNFVQTRKMILLK